MQARLPQLQLIFLREHSFSLDLFFQLLLHVPLEIQQHLRAHERLRSRPGGLPSSVQLKLILLFLQLELILLLRMPCWSCLCPS